MDFNYPENSLVVVGALLRLVVCSLRIVGPLLPKNDQRQGHPGAAVHLLSSVRGPSVGFLEEPCKTQHMARN